MPDNQRGKICLKKTVDKCTEIQQSGKIIVTPLMPKPIHQTSITFRVLNRHLNLFLIYIIRTKTFLEDYREIYKFPKTHTNRSIRRYNRLIKVITFILKEIENDVKRSVPQSKETLRNK